MKIDNEPKFVTFSSLENGTVFLLDRKFYLKVAEHPSVFYTINAVDLLTNSLCNIQDKVIVQIKNARLVIE